MRLVAALFLLMGMGSAAAGSSDTLSALAADGRFAGVVLTAGSDGRVEERAFGTVLPDGEAFTGEEVWLWASVTKMVTSLLVLQLVDEGIVALDAPATDYVEGLPEETGARTLRQLLMHTSGLPNPEATPENEQGLPSWYAADEPDRAYCYGDPVAEAGARFDYNNCDYVLLQDVLEAVTGDTYAELVAERIAEPLGLGSVGLLGPGEAGTVVRGFSDGRLVDRGHRLSNLAAAGALAGTPRDLLALDLAVLRGDVVSEGALALLQQGEPALGYVSLGVWSYPAQLPGCGAPLQLIERQGDVEGAKVLNLLSPSQGRAVVAFSNRNETDWGWIWAGEGLTYELAAETFCGGTP